MAISVVVAVDPIGDHPDELWDEAEGFFYDVLRMPDNSGSRLRVRSIVGLIPLFATEVALGQTIYNDPNANSSAAKGAHIAVGSAITGLFAVNTVTGVWNMWESRHEPEHHKLKLVHGILMLAADAGFVATFATGPGGRGANIDSEKQQHRTIALTSMGIATASYLLMLFGNK